MEQNSIFTEIVMQSSIQKINKLRDRNFFMAFTFSMQDILFNIYYWAYEELLLKKRQI